MLTTQKHAHQARTPTGVLLTQYQGLVHQFPKPRRVRIRAAGVGGSNGIVTLQAKAAHQMTHGAWDKSKDLSDRRDALSLFDTLSNKLTQRQRSRMWHEQSSLQQEFHLDAHGTLSFAGRPAKPAVGISGKTMCRN
jgi:hypothetical protein